MTSPGQADARVAAAATLAKHAMVYGAGSFLGLALTTASAVVLTAYLEPAEFGRFGLAMVAASLITIGLNAPIGQGALIRAFGGSEDEVVDPDHGTITDEFAQRSFGSALVATVLGGTCLTILAILGSLPVVDASGVRLAALTSLCGAAGALWRLLSAVPRLERRPGVYVSLALLRPIAVLGITLPLVMSGGGVESAVAGVFLGTAASNAAAATVVRSRIRPAIDRGELGMMLHRSRPLLPLIAGTWLIQNADLYIVATLASAADVGHYRLASRLAALGSYGTSAFLSAWGPLELSAVFRESDEQHGREGMRGVLLFQFLMLAIALVLTIAVLADELVRIAPPSYAAAAELVPWLGLAFVAQGVLTAIYRAGDFRRKARADRKGSLVAGLAFLPLAAVLVSWRGPVGAAIAAITVILLAIAVMVRMASADGAPIRLPMGRLCVAGASAGGLYVASTRLDAGTVHFEALVHILCPVAFVLIAVCLWPPSQRRALVALLRAVAGRERGASVG